MVRGVPLDVAVAVCSAQSRNPHERLRLRGSVSCLRTWIPKTNSSVASCTACLSLTATRRVSKTRIERFFFCCDSETAVRHRNDGT